MGLMAPGSDVPARCSSALARNLTEVDRVVDQAIADLEGAVPHLAIVTLSGLSGEEGAGRLLADVGRRVRTAYPDCTVIGANAHGVFAHGEAVEMTSGLSLWLAAFSGVPPTPFRIATVPAPHGGMALTGLPDIGPRDRLAIMLADPWTLPVDDAIAGMVGEGGLIPVVGGLASAPGGRGAARLLLNGAVFDGGAVGVLIDESCPVRVVVSQGCRPIGSPMTVTGAQGQVISELAGATAVERLREVITGLDEADQSLAVRGLHLGIAHGDATSGEHAADYVIRGILGMDATTGAIRVGDDVPVGSVVRLHLRDADSATMDLQEVVAAAHASGSAAGAYVVTCNGRGRAMFPTSDHDANVVGQGLSTDNVAGFFAAGEIGPVAGRNHLHGFTAVVIVVDATSDAGPVEIERPRGDAPESTDLDAELRALLGE